MYTFLSEFRKAKYDNITVLLPRKGQIASITINHGVKNDAVKELIEVLAETTFTTEEGTVAKQTFLDLGDGYEAVYET